MGKAALLSKLGMHEEARAHKSQTTRRKAIAFNASKEGGDSSVKKAQIKGRILRSVKRGIGAEEKKQGRKLTQEEKRTVATRALASEVKAIRSGTPEMKPKRGGAKVEKQKPVTTEKTLGSVKKVLSSTVYKKGGKKLVVEHVGDSSGSYLRTFVGKGAKEVCYKGKINDLNADAFAAKFGYEKGSSDKHSKMTKATKSLTPEHLKPKAEPVEQKMSFSDIKTAEDRSRYAKQEASRLRAMGNEEGAKHWDRQVTEEKSVSQPKTKMDLVDRKPIGSFNSVPSGAIKDWKSSPGDHEAAVKAAYHYARRDNKEMVVVPGNSYGQKVHHITTTEEKVSKFTATPGDHGVTTVTPQGQIFRATARDAKKVHSDEPVEQKIKLEDVKTPSDRAKYAKQEAEHQRSQGNEKAAKAWDDKAKEGRQAAISRDTIAKAQSQTNLFGVTDHASDMPLFGGHQEEPAKKPVSETKEPRGLQEVSPHDLHFDPKRFQYKLVHGETGASGSLTDVRKWDENLGGVMLVWRDPKDGKDYVVNGHNRNTLARKLGAEKVAVRYLPVDTPKEARVIGALANMSEGSGNALDAAKFLRDTGMNREQLEDKGIPMKQKVATDGLALSKLAPHLFDKVVQGDIPIERATLIGDRIHDHDNQAKLVDLIDKAQSKGRKITNDVVRELADTVQSAPSHTETQFDLFGASETTQNLALEKAELTAHVRSRLSREKKLFGLVSKSKAASELERGGNTIDTEKSKGISDQASQVLGVFDQLKNQSGPVSSAINKAVERIANGDNQKQVQDDLHKQLLTEIPQALGIRSRSDSDSVQATTGRSGEGQKRLRVKKS